MKRFIYVLFLMFVFLPLVFANPNEYDALYNDYQTVFISETQQWHAGGIADEGIVLTKKIPDSIGRNSQYYYSDGRLAFALNTDFEFIKDGEFIAVNNNELKFSKVLYDEERGFEQVELSPLEIQKIFPEAEVIRLSLLDNDNKMWISKGFFKKKNILFVNDSNKYYYKLTPKAKKAQDKDIKAMVTLSRFGIYNFKHYGERDGKLTVYVR